MKLRPYQTSAVEAIERDFLEVQSSLLVLPTGCGKTQVFSEVARRHIEHGRVMVIAHRQELVYQARARLEAITGHGVDIEMGEQRAVEAGGFMRAANIVCATVQTLGAGMGGEGRKSRFAPSDFGLLVIDEAHHATADSYTAVIDYFRKNPDLKVLGVTATPDRRDEQALGQVFDRCSYDYEIVDAIDDGFLVPIAQQFVSVEGLDFSSVRTTAGDLNGADLATLMQYEENLHGVARPTVEIAGDRKTLMFAASVAQAERLTEIINRYKPESARWVSGQTTQQLREETLKDFANNRFQFLVNCAVLLEGYDCPDIAVVAMARPTKSRALYAQCVGRGTRPLPGIVDGPETPDARRAAISASAKPGMLVIDFVGNSGRHKLCTTADILGGRYSEADVAVAEKIARESDEPVDMRERLEDAERLRLEREAREKARREAASRAALTAKVAYSTRAVSPFDILDITPAVERGWDLGKRASEKQAECLRKFGVPNPAELSFKHASQLIGKLIDRRKQNKCSLKQAQLLNRFGYSPETSFADAKRLIDAIASNGWKRPADPEPVAVGADEDLSQYGW